jgi:hypothetical protein
MESISIIRRKRFVEIEVSCQARMVLVAFSIALQGDVKLCPGDRA